MIKGLFFFLALSLVLLTGCISVSPDEQISLIEEVALSDEVYEIEDIGSYSDSSVAEDMSDEAYDERSISDSSNDDYAFRYMVSDSDSLNSAITGCRGSCEFVLGEGVYTISSVIPSNTKFVGTSPESILTKKEGTIVQLRNVHNVVFENIKFVNGKKGFHISNSHEIWIKNNLFYDVDGFVIYNTIENPSTELTYNIYIENNYLNNSRLPFVSTLSGSTERISVKNNKLYNCDTSNSTACIMLYNSGSYSEIVGNRVEDTVSRGIQIGHGGQQVTGVKVEGNYILNAQNFCIQTWNTIDTQISNNYCSDIGTSGIYLLRSERTSVVGNHVRGAHRHGIWVLNSKFSQVNNNQVFFFSRGVPDFYSGVMIENLKEFASNGTQVIGNLINGYAGPGIRGKHGIKDSDANTGTMVIGNMVRNTGQEAILISSQSTCLYNMNLEGDDVCSRIPNLDIFGKLSVDSIQESSAGNGVDIGLLNIENISIGGFMMDLDITRNTGVDEQGFRITGKSDGGSDVQHLEVLTRTAGTKIVVKDTNGSYITCSWTDGVMSCG